METKFFEIHRKILDDSTPFSKREKIDDAVNHELSKIKDQGWRILNFKHVPPDIAGADHVEIWLIKE